MVNPASTQPVSDPLLAEIVCRLVEAYQPQRIYLFGSAARGDAGPDSDYDIMVVAADDAPSRLTQSRLAYAVLSGLPRSGDILDRRGHAASSRATCSARTVAPISVNSRCASESSRWRAASSPARRASSARARWTSGR